MRRKITEIEKEYEENHINSLPELTKKIAVQLEIKTRGKP